MTITPDQIEVFLDDLARISLKHGVAIDPHCAARLVPLADVRGYESYLVVDRGGAYRLLSQLGDAPGMAASPSYIAGLDLADLSNHERLLLLGQI